MKLTILIVFIPFLVISQEYHSDSFIGYCGYNKVEFKNIGDNTFKVSDGRSFEIISDEIITPDKVNSVSSSYNREIIDSLIFIKINQYRRTKNIKPYIWSESLRGASKLHADYIAKCYAYSGHREPFVVDNQSLNTITSRIEKVRTKKGWYPYTVENVQSTYNPPIFSNEEYAQSVFDGWYNSFHHNEAMLSTNMVYGGCYTSYRITKIRVGKYVYTTKKITTVLVMLDGNINDIFVKN